MSRITIIIPDDCSELEAAEYALGCFNPRIHDYKRERPLGIKNASHLTFGDNRDGLFYKTKNSYNLMLLEMEGKKNDN